MCDCCCIPLGCIPVTTDIEKPEGYENPPSKMFCPKCGEINQPVFKKTTQFCCLCFIPCFPCGQSSTYLACPKCDFCTGRITGETCTDCHVTTASESKFCPNCGKERTSVMSNNRMDKTDQNKDRDQQDKDHPKKNDSASPAKKESRGKRIGEFKN